VVAAARPVVADLRPLVPNVRSAVTDARAVTRRLDATTAAMLPYLTDLQAFVYNTSSVMSLEDSNGGILRGLFQVTPGTVLPFQSR
jgi:phospholipid/cholesterol/gamma-HCH transport system substrate-binding protein